MVVDIECYAYAQQLKFSLSFGGEMKKETVREGASLADTPTWAVATVITVMIIFGFFVHTCLKHFGKVKLTAFFF